MDLRQIKIDADDFGLMTYDPAFMNTASCRSRITFIDGDKGILRYRGYPIEQLAEHSDLPRDRVPDPQRRAADASSSSSSGRATSRIHTMLHENIKKLIDGFQLRRAPDGRCSLSTVGALSTFYPDAKDIFDPAVAQAADSPADRQGADASPPSPTATASAARTSSPTTT